MALQIRRFRKRDLEPLHVLLSDPRVMRFLEKPYTGEQTRRFLEKAGLSRPPLIYAAEQDGNFIGYVIFRDYDRQSMEIGWVLYPDYWGKGYASQLTELLIGKAAAEGKQAVIECVPEHCVTRHIAGKFGFTDCGVTEGLSVYRRDIPGEKVCVQERR